MSLILQIQEIVQGPIKDLYLELTGSPLSILPALPALPPVKIQVGPETVGDLGSSFGDLGSSFGDLGSSAGDFGSSTGNLGSSDFGSSDFGSSELGLNPSVF